MAYGNYAPFYRGGYFNPMQTPTMPNMADNQNQFVQPYQAPTQPNPAPMQNPIVPPTQTSNDIIWVQGEAGAKAYLVAPNNTVTLWDSESPTIYVKSADMNGVPSMRVLDFTERTANVPQMPTEHVCKCGDKFANKDDITALQGKFDDILGRISDLEDKYNSLSAKSTAKSTKTTKGDAE